MGYFSMQFDTTLKGNITIPDLMFGYDSNYVLTFLNRMGKENLLLFQKMLIIWDSVFPVLYTTLNLFLFSFLFRKRASNSFWWINILPLFGLLFDLLENCFELMMLNSYLKHSMVENNLVSISSMANQLKWSFTFILYSMMAFGIFKHLINWIQSRKNFRNE
jgi:hypothetical protein